MAATVPRIPYSNITTMDTIQYVPVSTTRVRRKNMKFKFKAYCPSNSQLVDMGIPILGLEDRRELPYHNRLSGIGPTYLCVKFPRVATIIEVV
jgi:hypothetical protein